MLHTLGIVEFSQQQAETSLPPGPLPPSLLLSLPSSSCLLASALAAPPSPCLLAHLRPCIRESISAAQPQAAKGCVPKQRLSNTVQGGGIRTRVGLAAAQRACSAHLLGLQLCQQLLVGCHPATLQRLSLLPTLLLLLLQGITLQLLRLEPLLHLLQRALRVLQLRSSRLQRVVCVCVVHVRVCVCVVCV